MPGAVAVSAPCGVASHNTNPHRESIRSGLRSWRRRVCCSTLLRDESLSVQNEGKPPGFSFTIKGTDVFDSIWMNLRRSGGGSHTTESATRAHMGVDAHKAAVSMHAGLACASAPHADPAHRSAICSRACSAARRTASEMRRKCVSSERRCSAFPLESSAE